LYGADTRLLAYHKPTSSFRWLGLRTIGIKDDEKSVSDPTRISYPPLSSKIFGLAFNLPVMKTFLLKGELVFSNTLGKNEEAVWGKGIILGMSVKFPDKLVTNAAYLMMDPDYRSLYKALSYESNKKGFRISSSYDIIDERFSLWVFYKWLKEIESTSKNHPDFLKTQNTLSSGVSLKPLKDLTLQTSYIIESIQLPWEILKHSMNGELIYFMARRSSLALKYQYIMNRGKINKENDYNARITSFMMSSKF